MENGHERNYRVTIADLFTEDRIVFVRPSGDKLRLIRGLAATAATVAGLDSEALAAALLRREDLGSTGLGGGVAVPHARLPGVSRAIGLLAILEGTMEFDAIDGQPVGLVCLLVLPDNAEALGALATVSRVLRNTDLVARLRKARTSADAIRLLLEGQA